MKYAAIGYFGPSSTGDDDVQTVILVETNEALPPMPEVEKAFAALSAALSGGSRCKGLNTFSGMGMGESNVEKAGSGQAPGAEAQDG